MRVPAFALVEYVLSQLCTLALCGKWLRNRFGTHPVGPATLQGSGTTVQQWLTENAAARGALPSPELPFLFKVPHCSDVAALIAPITLTTLHRVQVLSVGKALSVQAHPDKALAVKLHASRPDLYKDDNHKPEMAVALTRFEAMCGFRAPAEIAAHLSSVPELKGLVGDARTCALL